MTITITVDELKSDVFDKAKAAYLDYDAAKHAYDLAEAKLKELGVKLEGGEKPARKTSSNGTYTGLKRGRKPKNAVYPVQAE